MRQAASVDQECGQTLDPFQWLINSISRTGYLHTRALLQGWWNVKLLGRWRQANSHPASIFPFVCCCVSLLNCGYWGLLIYYVREGSQKNIKDGLWPNSTDPPPHKHIFTFFFQDHRYTLNKSILSVQNSWSVTVCADPSWLLVFKNGLD